MSIRVRTVLSLMMGVLVASWLSRDIQGRVTQRQPGRSRDIQVAVTPSGYDDIGTILTNLGLPFQHVSEGDLLDPNVISQFDTICANCSVGALTQACEANMAQNLRQFVEQGGRFYASDFTFSYLQQAFPDVLEFYGNHCNGTGDPFIGMAGGVRATVEDAQLREFLGQDTVELEYDLDAWVPIKSVSSDVTVLLRGTFPTFEAPVSKSVRPGDQHGHVPAAARASRAQNLLLGPLAVMFRFGEGSVLYTTFHLHAQRPDLQKKILGFFFGFHPPAVPTLVSPDNNATVSPTPTLKVTADDPDGDQVKFVIEVKKDSETKTFETDLVASGAEASFTVPSDKALASGRWTWRAKGVDSRGLESAWCEPRTLTVSLPVGRIIYHSYTDYGEWDGKLWLFDSPDGTPVWLDLGVDHAINADFSPDGSMIVFMAVPKLESGQQHTAAEWDIYLYDFVTRSLVNLTAPELLSGEVQAWPVEEDPKFSPDGRLIVFKRSRNATRDDADIWTMHLDGTHEMRVTQTHYQEASGPCFSPDGAKIAYWEGAKETADVYVMNSDGSGRSAIAFKPNVQEMYPVFLTPTLLAYSCWEAPKEGSSDDIYTCTDNGTSHVRAPFCSPNINDSDPFPISGDWIGFSSDRPGGTGGYDLYLGNLATGGVRSLPQGQTPKQDLGGSYTPVTVPPSERTIIVTSEPEGANFTIKGMGARYERTGRTPWTEMRLFPGHYVVTWDDLPGYQTPNPQTCYLYSVSEPVRIKGMYSPGSPPPVAEEFFDDFSYQTVDQAIGEGHWIVRTGERGWPGPGVGRWEWLKQFVEFDPEKHPGLMRLLAWRADDEEFYQADVRTPRRFLEGTYAARVKLTDGAASPDATDPVVQAFYSINTLSNNAPRYPDFDPCYSECDFEYLTKDAWEGRREPVMYVTTWEKVQMDPWEAWKETTDFPVSRTGSWAGWRTLLFQISGGVVSYYIDGKWMAVHDAQNYPDAAMSINFQLWFAKGEWASSSGGRYEMDVDWVYHAKGVVLSPQEVEQKVEWLRANSPGRKDTMTPPPSAAMDLMICNKGETTYAGDDPPGQNVTVTKSQSVANGATAIYQLKVQNDWNVSDTLTIREVPTPEHPGGPGWTVKYYDAQTGGNDITNQVTSEAGWPVPRSLSPGESMEFRVEVTPDATVSAGTAKDVGVSAEPNAEPGNKNYVKAMTRVPTLAKPIIVTDEAENKVIIFGQDLSRSEYAGKDVGGLDLPSAAIADREGYILIADQGYLTRPTDHRRILKVELEGSTFGSGKVFKSFEQDIYPHPHDIWQLPNGNFLVCTTGAQGGGKVVEINSKDGREELRYSATPPFLPTRAISLNLRVYVSLTDFTTGTPPTNGPSEIVGIEPPVWRFSKSDVKEGGDVEHFSSVAPMNNDHLLVCDYGGRIFEVVPDDTKKYTPLVDMSKDVSKQECKITHASETSDGGILFAARWSEKLPTGEKVYKGGIFKVQKPDPQPMLLIELPLPTCVRELSETANPSPLLPALLSPPNGGVVSPTPVFRMKYTDPDGDQVKFVIEVTQGRTVKTFETAMVESRAESTFSIPQGEALSAGAYGWRVKARDSNGAETEWSDAQNFSVPSTLPDVTRSAGLSTFALAVQMAMPTLEDMGMDGVQIARWDPVNQQYLLQVEQMQMGQAYWVKTTEPVRLQFAGQEVRESVLIALKRGWNLIGAPFLRPLNWDLQSVKVRRGSEEKSLAEAAAAGWMETHAWGWQQDTNNPDTGRYVLVYDRSIIAGVADQLEPWKGYWVKAKVECDLILPPPGRDTETRRHGDAETRRRGWSLRLQARTPTGNEEVILGEVEGRALAMGRPPEPPMGSNPMQVALLRNGEPLAVDVRRGVDFRQVWDVVVQAEEEIRNPQSAIRNPAEVVLTWPDLREVPSGVFLTLVDTATGTRRSLRTTRHYLYRPAEGETSRRFQIIAERSAPQVLQITDLQAEPTRGPGVRLTFTLTQAAQTNVVVRSLSGQAVQQIEILRSRETGANTTTWDGRDEQGRPVPNGVYLCEVTAHGEDGELARAMRTVRINR